MQPDPSSAGFPALRDLTSDAAGALVCDPKASDSELLGELALILARLGNSTNPFVRLATAQICRGVNFGSREPSRPIKRRMGRKLNPESPYNAVVIFYFHRLLRFLDGNNLSAPSDSSNCIAFPVSLLGDPRPLEALNQDTHEVWFDSCWNFAPEPVTTRLCRATTAFRPGTTTSMLMNGASSPRRRGVAGFKST
jgi:hypothetical protein